MKSYSLPRWTSAAAVLIVMVIGYGRVVSFGWAWDDYLLFVESPFLRSDSVQWSAILRPIIAGTSYFRPLVLLSFVAEFKTLGVGAGAAHAVNLAIFIANTALVYVICLRLYHSLGGERAVMRATLAAITYGLHPAMIEPVAWVSGRFDLLCTTFALAAVAVSLSALHERSRAVLIGVAFGAALLCKEMAITLPLTLGLVVIASGMRDAPVPWIVQFKVLMRSRWPSAVVMILVAIGYLIFRFVSIGKMIHVDRGMLASFSTPGVHATLILQTLFFYLSSAFVPFAHLSPFHPFDYTQLTSSSSVAICSMMLGIVLLAIMGTGRRSVPACLFLTFIVSLLPVLQIVPLTIAGSIGAERFLAMPLAFLVFAVFSIEAVAVPAISARIQILSGRMLLAGWLLLAAGCLYVTLPLWRSDLTLWTWTYQQHPDSALLRQSYVVAAVRERDFDSAKKVFDQMLGGDGFDPVMQMIYGNYLIKISQDEEGIAYLQGAIAVFPRPDLHPEETLDEANYRYLAYGFSSLAVGYLDLHNFAEALTAARLSQWYRPFSDTSKLWESLALYGLGRQQDADAAFDQVLKWQPESEHPMMYEQRDKLMRSLSSPVDGNRDITGVSASGSFSTVPAGE